jgi:phosphoglycerate-specific signal transduction histidine kinase
MNDEEMKFKLDKIKEAAKLDKLINRLVSKRRNEAKKSNEYKELQNRISEVESLLLSLKREKRKILKDFITFEEKELKEKSKLLWNEIKELNDKIYSKYF